MKKEQKELYSLMSAQHDGLLDESATERIAELLEGDAQAQRYYLELGTLFHELEETYHGHCADSLVEEYPRRREKIIPLFGWAAAIAASLVAAFLLVPRSGTERSPMLVDSESTIVMENDLFFAHVVDSSGVEWGSENTVEIINGELRHGMLDLAKGSLDVVFDNGVRFGFAAPVKMDLTSQQRLTLHSGGIVVDVPGLSEGVVINTPDGVLMANTARAHILCDVDQATLLNVERGSVDLFTENGQGREVRRSIVGTESVRIASGAAEPVIDNYRVIEPRIDLSQPAELENLQYVHYRFDETQGESVKNYGTMPNADGWLAGTPEYPAPLSVPGRFGRALAFSGHGEGVLADLKDFGSDEPGSVAFWIKMEPGMVPGKYENIFTWHMYTLPEKGWHADDEKELACRIRINHSAAEGVVGAVRMEFRNRWICGTTDLRDGRWHHVTAVFHRGYQGTMVRHYIDGELARSSARGATWFPTERYPEIRGGSIAVGRIYWPDRPDALAPSDPWGLRGTIDELYVFNQAVLPSHASRLHMKNTPDQVLDVTFVPWAPHTIAMASPLR